MLCQSPNLTYPTPQGGRCGLRFPDRTLTYVMGSCSTELHFHIPLWCHFMGKTSNNNPRIKILKIRDNTYDG